MRVRLTPSGGKAIPAGRPGHRFQNRYRARQRSAEQSPWRRLGRFGLALGAAAVGVVLVFIPGPAFVFFILAGTLLASDWLWMARLLDWGEVRVRRVARKMARWWRHLSTVARAALCATGASASLVTAYGAYRLMQ